MPGKAAKITITERQQLLDHQRRFHAREPDVEPLELVGKPRVIDAAKAEDRGVEVAHVKDVANGLATELVGGAVGDASLDATAGHPDREAEDVMIAA